MPLLFCEAEWEAHVLLYSEAALWYPEKALGDGLHAQGYLFQKILFLFERMTDKLVIHDYLIFVFLKKQQINYQW